LAPSIKFCRINLSKTNYQLSTQCCQIINPDILELNSIYKKYCQYKKFKSVMPIFNNQWRSPLTELLGYYCDDKLVAFSLMTVLDSKNIESTQFAWDYNNPRLRLGIESLKSECAIYKNKGYQYLYLGQTAHYKEQLEGYEMLGEL
jgi:hypothetical protein